VAVGPVLVSVRVPLEGNGGEEVVPLVGNGGRIVMTVVEAMTEVMTVMLEPGLLGVDDGLVLFVPAVEVKLGRDETGAVPDDPGAVPVPQVEEGTELVLFP
jgi:hypothetical protein